MMKKVLLLFVFAISCSMFSNAQTLNEMVFLKRYSDANSELPKVKKSDKRVVFLGNSITEGWVDARPEFFTSNNYVGRGIGGQTSPQLLLRFRQDVIDLNPVAVVINIGTNDIAGNTGEYDPKFTIDNIKSMADLAMANGIIPILTSVLPVKEYPWNKEVKDVPAKIDALNKEIKAFAEQKGFFYVDYNSRMREEDGALKKGYGDDGVHPNVPAYEVMEAIVKYVIGMAIGR